MMTTAARNSANQAAGGKCAKEVKNLRKFPESIFINNLVPQFSCRSQVCLGVLQPDELSSAQRTWSCIKLRRPLQEFPFSFFEHATALRNVHAAQAKKSPSADN